VDDKYRNPCASFIDNLCHVHRNKVHPRNRCYITCFGFTVYLYRYRLCMVIVEFHLQILGFCLVSDILRLSVFIVLFFVCISVIGIFWLRLNTPHRLISPKRRKNSISLNWKRSTSHIYVAVLLVVCSYQSVISSGSVVLWLGRRTCGREIASSIPGRCIAG